MWSTPYVCAATAAAVLGGLALLLGTHIDYSVAQCFGIIRIKLPVTASPKLPSGPEQHDHYAEQYLLASYSQNMHG